MLKRILLGSSLAAALLLVGTSAAQAQKVFSVGVSGGLSLPMGDMSDVFASGFHVGGHVNIAPPSLPIEILLDGTYHGFEENSDLPPAARFKFSSFDVSGSAAYAFSGMTMRPYIMGGVGMYFGKVDAPGAENDSEFGFHAGAGLRFLLSGFNTFLQGRINFVGDFTYVPISFGILF